MEEYDAAYAATVAAVAYAIASREEEMLASQETSTAEKFTSGNKRRFTEKLGSQKKSISVDKRPTLKSPTKRGESLKRSLEGSKMSRWLSGKEPVDDGYDDEQGGIYRCSSNITIFLCGAFGTVSFVEINFS